ncbi:DEAD/DEAH box helicase family protein [Chrysosporum bergii ANA360D]|uniref:DEAD/DEAH box helicase family protein n=1 Tax=Chrysosporum bergii ANA360D TaxID=617107 RepID=A0AA43GRY9_9CYAN|nr:DEAD/DEAH box helicase family protein [Chrysosporum bergii]MDH6060653.1 DEAD/DEAH box helicase family protein [Chrysosporum bergii ANA360D]
MGLGEADTRVKLIDPILHDRGWTEDYIKREETPGSIEIIDHESPKRSRGRVDYTLRLKVRKDTQPVAVALIEAKAEDIPPTQGLEQVKRYAQGLNVKFVFSSNGHLYVEYDRFTGITTQALPLRQFPTPEELRRRYQQGMGFDLVEEVAKPLITPYKNGESERRYYQDAAIRAAFEKIARCEKLNLPKRVLLSLATGAGKTFIAGNLLRRVADAGQLRRALFVCDRDELRIQATGALQVLFGGDAATVEGKDAKKNARVLIATYQTLDVSKEEDTANFLTQNYPVNYFSHIIIDECHRSAWGKWSQVLTRNPDAVQIGLTATPRQLVGLEDTPAAQQDAAINADNLRYFGEPVYEYDIGQGIEDGYLAACEIITSEINIDKDCLTIDEIMARNPRNAITGQPVTRDELEEEYKNKTYENKILLPDRVIAMCEDLFKYLLATGSPEQKTIIFCVRDRHADDVAAQLNNLYAQWCQQEGKQPLENYAFKCTAKSSGNDYLPDLKGSSRSHFIATTVDLLTTGVDVPWLENIVFFRYLESPITFYQMVGRGTRLNVSTNKMMFRVYDYTNATRLFGEEFLTKISRKSPNKSTPVNPQPKKAVLSVVVEGFDVNITPEGRYTLTNADGKGVRLPVEEYRELLTQRLVT